MLWRKSQDADGADRLAASDLTNVALTDEVFVRYPIDWAPGPEVALVYDAHTGAERFRLTVDALRATVPRLSDIRLREVRGTLGLVSGLAGAQLRNLLVDLLTGEVTEIVESFVHGFIADDLLVVSDSGAPTTSICRVGDGTLRPTLWFASSTDDGWARVANGWVVSVVVDRSAGWPVQLWFLGDDSGAVKLPTACVQPESAQPSVSLVAVPGAVIQRCGEHTDSSGDPQNPTEVPAAAVGWR